MVRTFENGLSYAIEDNTPLSITTYYRLKQTDFDGKHTYSPTISIQSSEKSNGIAVYPNPTKDRVIYIQTDEQMDAATLVSVYDVRGQLVFNQFIHESKILLPPSVSAGLYFIKIINSKTQAVTQAKFMVE